MFECNFNDLSEGQIDGQTGWDVFDKIKDSSAFSVATEVGTTETIEDKALIVKASGETVRCVTDEPVRWLRKQTARIEFDFRVVVPSGKIDENKPVMVLLLGNSVLNEKGRWEMRLGVTTNGVWKLTAALPDEASQTIPVEKFNFTSGESTMISDWLHCVVEVQKLSASDSFKSSVCIQDKSGQTIGGVICSDIDKDKVTRAMWNLSRLHAGFLASTEIHGLTCVDNFMLTTDP